MGVLRFIFFILFLSVSRVSFAGEPESFISPSPEKITRLSELHAQADGLMAENKFRQAVNVYTEIILLEPDDESAYANLGRAYMILGDRDRAKDAFRNALEINPDNPMSLVGLKRLTDPDASNG